MRLELQKLIADLRGKIKKHTSIKYSTRKLTDITSIAIHHSATVSGSAASFAEYHVSTNGWPGIGYTYVINKNGLIEWCNNWETTSYHVGNSNKYSLGICLVGDFTKEKPTKEQLKSSYMLIEYLTGKIKSAVSIKGHSEYTGYASKACPAFSMIEYRKNYSEWLKAQTVPAVVIPVPAVLASVEKKEIKIKSGGIIISTVGLFLDSTNYVAVRFTELFGYTVDWDAKGKSITLTATDKTVNLEALPNSHGVYEKIGAERKEVVIKTNNKVFSVNGLFIDGTNYVPIRFLAFLGFVVGWEAESKVVTLITPYEKEILYKITQAEAGGEDAKGKGLVINVIMNRIKSLGFPDSIEEVVFQPMQFEPTRNGAYEKAVVSIATKEAVDEALAGADFSQGALYFIANKSIVPGGFHESKCTRLFTHGGHTFYK